MKKTINSLKRFIEQGADPLGEEMLSELELNRPDAGGEALAAP